MGATSPNNDLYLKALRGESVSRPPVWMMRQAGRYLPEFMELKEKYDFFTRCQTPELASEITVQPLRRYGMDAAILFSDILVVPQAMNIDVEMRQGVGPFLPHPIRKATDLDRTNGLGDVVSYGELIPSGSIIHIGVKGGTNGQWKRLFDSSYKPSLNFINLEDNSAYHNMVISLKTATLGWKTVVSF